MKQVFLYIGLTALAITAIGLFVRSQENSGIISPIKNIISISSPAPEKKTIKVKDIEITVKIAKTDEERKNGLSNVKSLGENEGMLFAFEEENVNPPFWMKDMLIPIDIIWINDGKIVQIDKNILAPDPTNPDTKLKIFLPKTPIDYVLEVNAGFSDKNGIKEDDLVLI